ncbi:MAG TPA: hypothetical protein VIV59_05510 [Anaeromyxobacteraceae bacterium]
MKFHAVAATAALLALAGCGAVKVTRLSPGDAASAKPRDCALEFLGKAPERAYDEIAELDAHVTNVPRDGPLEVLREPACELGADAVIVTRNFVINVLGHVHVAGTAIRYRVEPAPPPPPPAGQAPVTD